MASCCICYSTFKSNDLLITTECGHVFHHACIHTWLGTNWNNPTCPNCRSRITQKLLRRIHLNFDEDTTQNNSIIHELQINIINMEDKLKQLERKIASAEKKYNTLLKTKETYQQRAAKLKEDIIELKENNKDLKIQLRKESKRRKLYEDECLALTAQINEIEDDW